MSADEVLPLIQELERRRLDSERTAGPPIWGPLIEQPSYWQVQGLARFWAGQGAGGRGEAPIDYPQHMGDLLTGVHGPGRSFSYLSLGTEGGVGFYLTLYRQQDESSLLRRSLHSIFPHIEVSPRAATSLGVRHNGLGLFEHARVLTGIATSKLTANPQE